MKKAKHPLMEFDEIPYIVFNTFGIFAIIISKIISNRKFGKKIDLLINNLNNFKMATQEQFDSVINRIDAATTHLASQVQTVISEVKAQGLPEAAENSIVNKLTDFASRLESIGASIDNPLPGVVGSSTPTALGEVPQEAITAPTQAGNDAGNTNTQPAIDDRNTGQNTPPSNGAKPDQEKANFLMNPYSGPEPVLPGDKQSELNGDDTTIQVGKQADANNGDTETDPNKDSNPANDEPIISSENIPESTENKTAKAKKAK